MIVLEGIRHSQREKPKRKQGNGITEDLQTAKRKEKTEVIKGRDLQGQLILSRPA